MYRPTSVPAPSDPHRLDAEGREAIERWIASELRTALERAYPEFGVTRPLRFVVEVVEAGNQPGEREASHAGRRPSTGGFHGRVEDHRAWTLIVGRDGATVAPGFDGDWDLYDVVAGSLFADVIAGRRHWGDLLLAGALRGFSRAYETGPRGLAAANVGEMFLYYALSYDESTRRAIAWQLAQAATSASAPRRSADS